MIRVKSFNPSCYVPVDKAVSDRDIRFSIVIDQRSGMRECLNYAGWPANEITLLMKLQQESPDSPLVTSLERSLMEIPVASVDNSALSDRQIIDKIIPKYVGTLSEYMRWVESLPLSDAERAMLDEQAKQQFSDDETESTPVATGGESS